MFSRILACLLPYCKEIATSVDSSSVSARMNLKAWREHLNLSVESECARSVERHATSIITIRQQNRGDDWGPLSYIDEESFSPKVLVPRYFTFSRQRTLLTLFLRSGQSTISSVKRDTHLTFKKVGRKCRSFLGIRLRKVQGMLDTFAPFKLWQLQL
jgi:hypothetical protein